MRPISHLFFFTFLILPSITSAEDLGKIYSKQGTVQIQKQGKSDWIEANIGEALHNQDFIKTSAESRVALLMNDGVMVRLNENSRFQLNAPGKTGGDILNVASGEAHFLSRKPKEFPTIKTPLVTASVRGTEFTVSSSPSESQVKVLQGSVFCKNDKGEASLSGGEMALVEPGKAPQKMLIVNPVDAVQWALYYPAVINPSELGRFSDKKLPESAALSLSRGQIEKAKAAQREIEKNLKNLTLDEQDSLTQFIRAQEIVIAIVQNKVDDGRKIADSAFKGKKLSTTGALALSYLEQASFDLKKAQEVIESALEADPNNPTLLARHAELLLSFGDSKEALKEAKHASEQSPGDPYISTVKGFAELARLDTDEAKESFQSAVSNGSGSGLPFLGLGLVSIREGDLAQGKTFIQQAVHLEPTVALYRSYLGKTFFEIEDEELAEQEYDRSIQLDEKDPTPYFYRSFEKLSTHRPIEALDDIEKSISLNDNRAVYRSRLLLDQDSAVRSSSLASIYGTLGFTELSRVEAIKSLSQDYSNYSAHLLLSESYDPLEDLLQASISEFLIARLLSPVTFNLVRPSQAGSVSSNEYTALFDRKIHRTEVGFKGDTKNRQANPSILQSGTTGRWGYALQYDQTYYDGYRNDDFSREHIVYGSLQHQLTADDTLLLDTNVDIIDSGDTEIKYNPNVNDQDLDQELDDYIVRLGYNHRFGPGQQLIGQVLFNNSDLDIHDKDFPRFLVTQNITPFDGEIIEQDVLLARSLEDISFHSRGIRFDTQYIESGETANFVIGGAASNADSEQRERSDVFDPLEISLPSLADNSEGARSIFNYTTFHVSPWLDVTGGVAYSHLRLSSAPISVPFVEETDTAEQWSPKAGLMLYPTSSTILRGAFFESVGTSGIRELERIEPTLISGFNQQFFDVLPGTRSRNFGVGIDQKFDTKTYVGVEGLRRNVIRNNPQTLSTLVSDFDTGEFLGSDQIFEPFYAFQDEDIVKAYLYQVITDRITGTAEYTWINDDEISFEQNARTNRVKLGLNYFDPSGFFTFAQGTWRKQDLDGFTEPSDDGANGERDFWMLDAGVGYKFPRRHGQITLSLTNILDNDFRYLPTGLDPVFYPGIGGQVAFTYNF